MTAELERLIREKPCVIVLDSVDPYCHKVVEMFDKFKLKKDSVTFFYVDKEDNKTMGDTIADQSKAHVKSVISDSNGSLNSLSLPHVYLGGIFFYGGQQLKQLGTENKLRNKLAEVGAITLPELGKVQSMINSSRLVVFLNSFSPFCLSTKDILTKVVGASANDESKVKFISVDKLTDGQQVEHAALFLGKCDNLPVVFANGNSIGSAKEIEALHSNFELYDVLGNAGVIRVPAHDELRRLKKSFSILLIGNNYSAYSLQIQEILLDLQVAAGTLKIEADGSEMNQDLEIAAMIETKTKEGPYIFIKEKFLSSREFHEIYKSNNKNIVPYLKSKNAL